MSSKNSAVNNAIVAYVPALHAGYLSFFSKHPGAKIFILGKSFIDSYPRLNRDIRALAPTEARTALTAMEFNAEVLEIPEAISTLKPFAEIILPDEDVSRAFAETYLTTQPFVLENVFLRWDKVVSDIETKVSPDRKITTEKVHADLMNIAQQEGEKSADWWRQIGALLVQDGRIVKKSHIRYFPSDLALDIFGTPRSTVDAGERPDLYISMHAEADLIAQAAHDGISLQGASLYTSTFPCINCAFLIAQSGITKVFYAKGYSRLDAEGVLKNAGIEVVLIKDAF